MPDDETGIKLVCPADERSFITFRRDLTRRQYADYLQALTQSDKDALVTAYRAVVIGINLVVGKQVVDSLDGLAAIDFADAPVYLETFIASAFQTAYDEASSLGKPTLAA